MYVGPGTKYCEKIPNYRTIKITKVDNISHCDVGTPSKKIHPKKSVPIAKETASELVGRVPETGVPDLRPEIADPILMRDLEDE